MKILLDFHMPKINPYPQLTPYIKFTHINLPLKYGPGTKIPRKKIGKYL